MANVIEYYVFFIACLFFNLPFVAAVGFKVPEYDAVAAGGKVSAAEGAESYCLDLGIVFLQYIYYRTILACPQTSCICQVVGLKLPQIHNFDEGIVTPCRDKTLVA